MATATSAAPRQAMPPEQRRVLYMVMAVTLTLDAGNGAVFGLIAEIQREHGFSTPQLGLISGALFAASLVGLLGLSHLSDKGHARTMLLAGVGLGGLGTLWFAVADDLWEFVAARVVTGIAFSLFISAGRSVVARLDPARAGENLGRLTAAEVAGFVSGPVVGALLADVGGLSLPFFVFGGIALAALVVFVAVFPQVPPPPGVEHQRYLELTGLDLLGNRRVLAAALLALAVFFPVGAYDAIWSKYLTDLGASLTFVGTSLSLYGVPLILLSARGGRLVDAWGPIVAARRAILLTVPIIVAYGFMPNYWLVALVAIVEAVVAAVANPSATAAMAAACPPDRIGAGQGLAAAFGLTGSGLLASFTPSVYDRWGPGTLFVGVGVTVTAIAVTGFTLDAGARRVTPATQPA